MRGERVTSERFAQEIVGMTGTLYRVSYSILREPRDREDAVQAALEKAWRKRTSLRDERYLRTWLTRILIHACYDILRRRKREIPGEIPERAAPPDADRELHDALLKLPEELRTPIALHYMEGYGVKEIASALRLKQGTIKSRMRRARLMLKQLLSEEGLP